MIKLPEERWLGVAANELKGKAPEIYAKMSIGDPEDYKEFKVNIFSGLRAAARSLPLAVPWW